MHKITTLFCLTALFSSISDFRGGLAAAAAAGDTPDISAIIAKYRNEIPGRMKIDNVPGLAIAVVDDQGILWSEGFGYTDWDRKTKVTTDTLFSIQSMSKSFTATAAMFAAQDGLVDLDAPITTYLPNFHIHSIFEEHPEQKITLRMLLSHTAGLVHEAPVGGNSDLPGRTFEEHIASISDTWLKFPVGTSYSYSNLGIDLAGYILQVRSGMPFTQYVKEKVLASLGMASSTLDISRVRATPGRAVGHAMVPLSPPIGWLLIPSGGVWTTANDMARYLRFHINEGTLDGTRLLRENLAETMYTPPNEAASQAGYALGIGVSNQPGTRELQHGGGGFGFNSNMIWYPELKLGAVVLTNTEQADHCVQLPGEILGKIVASDYHLYREREATAIPVQPAYGPIANGPAPLTDSALSDLIASKALPLDEAARQRRQAIAGYYISTKWGLPTGILQVKENNGVVTVTIMGQTYLVTEVQPGLFFDPQGNSYDINRLGADAPNLPLIKIDPQLLPYRLAFYGLCGLVFLSSLFFWPVWAVVRRIRRKKAPSTIAAVPAGSRRLVWWIIFVGLLAGLASLISLFCLAAEAIVPNLVYVPWPRPWVGLTGWQFAALRLPYASLFLAAGAAVLTVLAWIRNSGGRGIRIYYALVALALLGFNLAVLT
ncbi:MAG: serine hydrolase domain-containing protein [Anaerolineales bacterium]